MPFCPTCGQEYVDGVLTCSDCDVVLVPVPPPSSTVEYPEVEPVEEEASKEGDDTEPVEVWRAHGEIEAQLIRSLLESNGIASMLSGEALRITHGFTMDGLAEVRILVRPEDAERAREIIAPESFPRCPECGEPIRAEDTACPSCGERFEE